MSFARCERNGAGGARPDSGYRREAKQFPTISHIAELSYRTGSATATQKWRKAYVTRSANHPQTPSQGVGGVKTPPYGLFPHPPPNGATVLLRFPKISAAFALKFLTAAPSLARFFAHRARFASLAPRGKARNKKPSGGENRTVF